MRFQHFEKLSSFFEKHRTALLAAILFFIPIKLSITYALLGPTLLLWLIHSGKKIPEILSQHRQTVLPLIIFFIAAIFSSLFGLDPLNSISKLSKLLFFSLSIFMFYTSFSRSAVVKMISALLLGQSFAACHSVLHAAFPKQVPSLFVGHITESGQLSLTIILALGFILFLIRTYEEAPSVLRRRRLIFNICEKHEVLPVLIFLTVPNLLSFHSYLGIPRPFVYLLTLILLGSFAFAFCKFLNLSFKFCLNNLPSHKFYVVTFILPLLLAAILANLKRGPWAGVFVAALIFFFLFSRRLVLPIVLVSLLIFVAITPVRQRIIQSSAHFFISGGRSVIWEIGRELSARYPLGIGYKNSSFLQNFDEEIPETLNHFHNNALNITVETGWLGIGIFLWWLLSLLRQAFRKYSIESDTILARTLGCAFISWQVAGSVEYNFGDSEVLLVVFFLVALLSWISTPPAIQPNAIT